MSDIEFVEGLYFKEPRSCAPDYVKGSISIQPAKLSAWLAAHQGEEWVNAQVKESRGGKWYVAVDTWKPQGKRDGQRAPEAVSAQVPEATSGFVDDDIPFAPLGKHAHWIA